MGAVRPGEQESNGAQYDSPGKESVLRPKVSPGYPACAEADHAMRHKTSSLLTWTP